MAKVVVFDSGLGSLSIIKPIQEKIKAEIIYFADQKNFPYGTKSVKQLKKIIESTIKLLDKNFDPDLIVMGSNTPSLLLKQKFNKPKIIGVFPPLKEAESQTKTKTIAILTTKSVFESYALQSYIRNNLSKKIKVIKINVSPLVELVESGKFIDNKTLCNKIIKKILLKPFLENNVDVATLSSTHLPFLLPLLQKIFPQIVFLDPGNFTAEQIARKLKYKNGSTNFSIFSSGDIKSFQKRLSKIGIRNKVRSL